MPPCSVAAGARSARFDRAAGVQESGRGLNGHPAFLDHRSIPVSAALRGFGTGALREGNGLAGAYKTHHSHEFSSSGRIAKSFGDVRLVLSIRGNAARLVKIFMRRD